MAQVSRVRRQFIEEYSRKYLNLRRSAREIEEVVYEILNDANIYVHTIEARAKRVESLQLKLLEKKYTRPEIELTDRLGVRVITYYSSDLDPVVGELRKYFEIDERRSVDKRYALGPREFGYKSIHLIAKLPRRLTQKTKLGKPPQMWFEIQVRSILEHAWAEIEHEIVYKSGVKYPPSITRRFAALAGTLELLDKEFLDLKKSRDTTIGQYLKRYQQGLDTQIVFDSARLLAFLECIRPRNLSWRNAEHGGNPFPPKIEVVCVEALKVSGLRTPRALMTYMETDEFKNAVRRFTNRLGIGHPAVSHLALTVIAIKTKRPSVAKEYLSEMVNYLEGKN